jgi:hypothetical protein
VQGQYTLEKKCKKWDTYPILIIGLSHTVWDKWRSGRKQTANGLLRIGATPEAAVDSAETDFNTA